MSESHLLRIRHRTHYQYALPVSFQTHRLVLRPREGHDLRVENLLLTIQPRAEVVWTRDIFGNSIAHAIFQEQGQELLVDLDVTVRRFFDPAQPPALVHSPMPYPLEYDTLEHGIIVGYLTPVYAEETAAVKDFIATLPDPGESPSAEAFVVQVAEIIHQRIHYQRREKRASRPRPPRFPSGPAPAAIWRPC